jgi:hypothetical protein
VFLFAAGGVLAVWVVTVLALRGRQPAPAVAASGAHGE